MVLEVIGLLSMKRGEKLSEEQLYQLYIEQNLSFKQIGELVHRDAETVRKWCILYRIKKDKQQVLKSKQNTYFSRTGYANPMNNPEIIQKRKENCLKTGYEHPMQNPENRCSFREDNPMKSETVKETLRKSNREKYGTDWYMQTEEFRVKSKETFLNSVGVDNPMKCEEYKLNHFEACLEKYGCYPSQSDAVKQQIKDTCLNRFGEDNPQKNTIIHEKSLKTREEKYGDSKLFGTKSFKVESMKTCIEKYGYPTASKSPEVKERTKQHNLEKYGTEWPLEAIYETKRMNNSFHTSKIEDKIYSLLCKKFIVQRQYRSEAYPFACDFYLEELNLYIEYNGSWTHGGQPFSEDICKDKLKNWEEKAKTSKYYKNAITTWTIRDVLKRETARKNCLNWIEFFSFKDFEKWFTALTKTE